MGRTLKIVGIVIVVLILIVVIAPFLIPVNSFRPQIEQQASAALGRKVEIGNLSLSLFSGSLGADNLSIADDPKFSSAPFLTAKSFNVGVEVWPLITSKTLNVTSVVIDSPQVSLIRNAAGDWNYSTLGASPTKAQAQAAPAPAAPATPAAKPATPASASGGAPPAFTVQKLELKSGQITVSSVGSAKKSSYSNVNVTASNVSLVSKFPVTVTADLPGGGNFKVDGTTGPVNETNSVLTPLSAKINVNSLNLASTGFVDPSAGLGGILDLDGNIVSENGTASTKGTTKLSKALLVAGGTASGEPVTVKFDTAYNLTKNTGVLNPSVLSIGTAACTLTGTYEIPAQGAVLHIKVVGQGMPGQSTSKRFCPRSASIFQRAPRSNQGTLSTTLDLTGPTDKLVTSGNVGLFGAKLAGFDLGSKMSSVSALTGIKTGQDMNVEKMTSNVRVAPDGIQADQFNAVVSQLGTLVGGGTINSKNQMDFKMAATVSDALLTASPVAGGASALLGQVMGGGATKCKGGTTTVPFQIQGTTSDPKFIPDVGGLAAGLLKSQLGGGCAGGPAAGGQNALGNIKQNPAGAIQQLGGLFGKKKPN